MDDLGGLTRLAGHWVVARTDSNPEPTDCSSQIIAPRAFLWTVFGMHSHAISTRARQPPKTRNGSAKSAAFPKLRIHARKKCEHALVELGGIETQKSVRDVRLDR